MGVTGLLGLLKSIQKPLSLKEFNGKTIAVDAYGWLHRGAVACAVDLALGRPTTRHIDFTMHRVRMLKHFGIKPYLVFDGDRLPSKAGTEQSRAQRRKESKRHGLELLNMGKAGLAYQELQKSVDITPEMARQLIEELKRTDTNYVVAPYEADSQMVYLERTGTVDAILSEDSDLLVFGAQTLLTKLDQYGDCMMIRQSDFTACRDISMHGWTAAEFRCMAIMSGCDYLTGIPRMGLKTAYRFVKKYKTIDRILRAAQLEGKMRIPDGYLESYQQAVNTFLYQWVFCPQSQKLVNLNKPDFAGQLDGIDYIGKFVEADVAKLVATGDLDPMTKEPIDVATIVYRTPKGTKNAAFQKENSVASHKIDTFFKPQRTPLAELDPNIFTPSPSQRQLLTQQQGVRGWSSSSAPYRVNTAITIESRAISSAPSTSINTTNSKRQRLCSDVSDFQTERSRFFTSSFPDPSPSNGPTAKRKKAQKHDFTIMSDDSVEDAMLELSQLGSTTLPNPDPKLDVLVRQGSQSAKTDQKSIPGNSKSSIDNSPFSESLEAEFKALHEKTRMRELEPAPLKRSSSQSRVTLDYSRLSERDHDEPSISTSSPQVNHTASASLINVTPNVNKEVGSKKFVAASPPLRQADSRVAGIRSYYSASMMQGSEDLLVADSDESCVTDEEQEREEYVPTSSPLRGKESDRLEETVRRPFLDLKKFAYAALPGVV